MPYEKKGGLGSHEVWETKSDAIRWCRWREVCPEAHRMPRAHGKRPTHSRGVLWTNGPTCKAQKYRNDETRKLTSLETFKIRAVTPAHSTPPPPT